MDDLELLEAYSANGDEEAIRALVQKYRAMVLATCRRHAACEADAEDAMQEVFLSLLGHAGAIKSNVGGWLHRCAVNAAVLTSRNRQRRIRWENEKARASTEVAEEDLAARHEHLAILAGCLNELAEADRQVLLGNCVEGQTQRAIASSLGVTQQAVAKRLGRTLAELRRKLTSRGVILSLAAAVATLGKRAARAAIPQALRALGGSGHTTVAASGGTALGVAAKLKLLAAAIVVASAAAMYNRSYYNDLVRPAPDGDAAAAKSAAGSLRLGIADGRNWTRGPAAWAMSGVRSPQAAGLSAAVAPPGTSGTKGEPVAHAEDPRSQDSPAEPKATVAIAADTLWEDRADSGQSAWLRYLRTPRAHKPAASKEAGKAHELTGEESKDPAPAEAGQHAGQGGQAAAFTASSGSAPREFLAHAGESQAAPAGQSASALPPVGHPAEQADRWAAGQPTFAWLEGERAQAGHESVTASGGGEQEPGVAPSPSAGQPQDMPEVPHHVNFAPLAPSIPAAGAAYSPPRRPDSTPSQSAPAASPPAAAAAAAAVPEQPQPPSAAAAAVPDSAGPPLASAAAVPDWAAPPQAMAWPGAGGGETVPPDSLAAAVLDATGSPPLPLGGPPAGTPGPAQGTVAAPLSSNQAGADSRSPSARTWAKASDQAGDSGNSPGLGRAKYGYRKHQPVAADDQNTQDASPITLTPMPDDAPLRAVTAGGPLGQAADGQAGLYAGGRGRGGWDAPKSGPESAGNPQDFMPRGAGDSAAFANPVPEPTIAITLLACLPILLRRRGGPPAKA